MKIKELFKKYKEIILYLFFGFVTTAVSIGSFAFFEYLKLEVLIANILSWILSVFVAFVTNTLWVFEASIKTEPFKKALRFYGGRIFTLLVEEALLFIFIKLLRLDALAVKCIAQAVVIILNYIVSKLFVFGNKANIKE